MDFDPIIFSNRLNLVVIIQYGLPYYSHTGAESENFVWGGQVATLIFLSRQPHIHIYIHCFIIFTLFYLISYIYTTHQTATERA